MDSPLEPSASPAGDDGSGSGSRAEPATASTGAAAAEPPDGDVLEAEDDGMPPLPPLPGQRTPPGPADTPQRANRKRRCAVEGCGRQSQGGRNRHMCRSHYLEWCREADRPPGGAAPAGGDHAGGSSADSAADEHAAAAAAAADAAADAATGPPAAPAKPSSAPVRPRCRVAGCGRQSQGRRCGGMCQRHHNEVGHPPPAGARRPMGSVTVAGGGGAMAMAAATMADMNMSMNTNADNMSVSTLGTAASSTTPPGSGGQQQQQQQQQRRRSVHPLCSVVGCTKQSQGGRCNFMCASHFREKFGPGTAAVAGTAGGKHRRRRRRGRSRYNNRSSTHPLCAINGCPKQSQGGRCNFMCASHFKQYGYEPPPPESDDDDDIDISEEEEEEEDHWEAESDADDKVKKGSVGVGRRGDAYELNNGYYAPMSPEYNNSTTNFVVGEMDVDDTMPPLPSTNQSVPPIPPVLPPKGVTDEMPPLAMAEVASEGQRNGDPFAFEQTSGADVTASPQRPVPPTSSRRYASPGRVQDDPLLSPSQRRKRRLDKHIDHAKKVAASPAAPVVEVAVAAASLAPEDDEDSSGVPEGSNFEPLTEEGRAISLGHVSVSTERALFAIQSKPPPRRIEYPNHKSLQKQSRDICSSLTTLGPSADGSIHFFDTLGRCRIAESNECGFQWFPKGSTLEEFISSDFMGYNKGLGRVYFRSFIHRGRKIEVGNFVRKRFGNTTEYYRVAGAFQATVSFLGDWEDGSFPTEGSQNSHKGEIQKRGHPYLIVVPLKLKSDVVLEKTKMNARKARSKPSSAESGRDPESALHGEEGEKELVLTKEEEIEPNNIFVLPMWIGEPGVTFETISVRCVNEQGDQSVIEATDHRRTGGVQKCKHAEMEGTFVCRRAMNQSATYNRANKKRRKDLKDTEIEAESDNMLTQHLACEQFRLLTANPKELLESFVPRQWASSFDACRTQFIRSWEERPWYDDESPNLDFFPNPNDSSDDSDGFDEESCAALKDSVVQEADSDGETMKIGQHVPVPDIGEGWTVSETERKSGATKGRRDKTWHSPCGQNFRSLAQVKRFKAEQARQRNNSAPRKKS